MGVQLAERLTYSDTADPVVAPLTEAGNWNETLQFTFGFSAN